MYKIIHNGNVIDVIKEIKYLRYLKSAKKLVISDSSSANCIQASNNKDVYAIQGAKLPGSIDYPKVIIKKIDALEFNKLTLLLEDNTIITADSYELYEARENKIKELKSVCAEIITRGISIELSDGLMHQFELTIEDQLNLLSLKRKLEDGANSVIYHEKNKLCRFYPKSDIELIILLANKHIEYNTTYFNLFKNCINNMYDIQKIKDIHYGDKIPNPEYQQFLNNL